MSYNPNLSPSALAVAKAGDEYDYAMRAAWILEGSEYEAGADEVEREALQRLNDARNAHYEMRKANGDLSVR